MKLQKAPFIYTHKTQKDLNEYFDSFSGTEKAMLYLGSALTWNMLAHMLETQDDERGPA
jgi:hypothetical protein